MARGDDREFRHVLSLVSRTFKSACADGMRGLGVHVGQNFLLDELFRQDRLTAGDLARRIGVEQPTVTRMSQRMEAAGLVTRERDETDARVIRIALTEQGQNLRVRLPALLDDIAHEALHGLTAAERAQLVDLLERVADNLATPTTHGDAWDQGQAADGDVGGGELTS